TVAQTQPALYKDGVERNSSGAIAGSDLTDTVTVVLTTSNELVDFTEQNPDTASVSGRVYFDENQDGTITGNDTLLANVDITLTGKDIFGTDINLTTQTSAQGEYTFENLFASDANGYTVAQTQPALYKDGVERNSSGAIAGSDLTDTVTVVLTTSNELVDFTEQNPDTATISGRVYFDANQDGTIADNDKLLAGVAITLIGKDIFGTDINLTTQTSAQGEYTFADLFASDASGYTVTQTQPALYKDGVERNTSGAITGSNVTDTVTVVLSTSNQLVDFTEQNPDTASVSGRVYFDENQDGTITGNDTLLANVDIALTGKDIFGTDINLTTQTSAQGEYSFANLFASDDNGYTVTQTQPALYKDGVERNNTGMIAGSDLTDTVTVALSTNNQLVDFTEQNPDTTTISGRVYFDENQDGTIADNDTLLTNVDITLTGKDIFGSDINLTTQTNAQGEYTFENLFASDANGYTVAQTQPALYKDGVERNSSGAIAGSDLTDTVTVVLTTSNELVDFTEQNPDTATISGRVYFDENQDGTITDNDKLLANVDITLTGQDIFGSDINLTTQTNVQGEYTFADLFASDANGYNVTQTQPALYKDGVERNSSGVIAGSDTSDTVTVQLIANENQLIDFTEMAKDDARIAGFVFSDENMDGLRQSNEQGISDVVITLAGQNIYGNAINATVLTNAQGEFAFVGLSASDVRGYVVKQVQPENWLDGLESLAGRVVNSQSINDKFTVTLSASEQLTALGFAELASASLSGYVFVDTDKNNIRTAQDLAIEGVELTVSGRDYNNNPVTQSATTDSLGLYAFKNLAPSNEQGYQIQQTQPKNYIDGFESIGQDVIGRSDQSDIITAINVKPSQESKEYNFAENYGLSVKGRVFIDHDDDGFYPVLADSSAQQSIALANVEITLSGKDYRQNDILQTVMTNEFGYYEFPELSPSNEQGYTLEQQQPKDYLDGLESAQGEVIADSRGSNIIVVGQLQGTGEVGYFDFAELPASSLAGKVWVDANESGTLDEQETLRIRDVTVTLTGVALDGENVTRVTKTNEQGQYTFDSLKAGTYAITQTQPSAWLDGKEQLGSLSGVIANDNFSEIQLELGQQGNDYNFAETGSYLSGTVYVDLNDNATQEDNEIGIAQVQMHIEGIDLDGQAVVRMTTTDTYGRYQFKHLPLSDVTGFTITQTQPEQTQDGKDSAGSLGGVVAQQIGADEIKNININEHITLATEYNFGEQLTNPASISGSVWQDNNHNRADDDNNGKSGWLVELLADPQTGEANPLEAEPLIVVRSNEQGDYTFAGLPVGVYEVRFRHPQGGVIYGIPVSNDADTSTDKGTILNIILSAGEQVVEQSLPVDPSGIVYDSRSREPIKNAKVSITGPAGFEPDLHLVGGLDNVEQTTADDGFYQFLLFANAPVGEYQLAVTAPVGFLQGESKLIPACTARLEVSAQSLPVLVHQTNKAPVASSAIHDAASCPTQSSNVAQSNASTQYYTRFYINPQLPSANVVNNHIPVDGYGDDLVQVTKTALKQDVVVGEMVPYEIVIFNRSDKVLQPVSFIDQLPAGLKYVIGSARIDGISIEPRVFGRQLIWPVRELLPQQTVSIQLLTVVGAGVSEGKYINQAWVEYTGSGDQDNPDDGGTPGGGGKPGDEIPKGKRVSNIAIASIRVIPDTIMDCSDLTGQVFDDHNRNGIQEQGETGLPGVKLATAQGLWITTDQHGRYHLACADVPHQARGSNFIIKVDVRSLPSGYRITSENPRVVRLTRGKNVTADFAASIHRVARVQLSQSAFDEQGLIATHRQQLEQLLTVIVEQPITVRVAYQLAENENIRQAKQRIAELNQWFIAQWNNSNTEHELTLEAEVVEYVLPQEVVTEGRKND
uniref:SdrD B-like domain-containing protein n=1 Tax=Pseudoalteromonas sp. Ld20 TaxID=649165 RepID=UPI003865DF47